MKLDFIIGRDANTAQLRISTADGKKTQQIGTPGSVPMNVSRKHLQLTVNDDKTCVVKNINVANQTFVDGVSIVSKQINWGDRVELGANRYLLDWRVLESMLPKVVDISNLNQVWETYNQRIIDIRKRQKNNGLLASVPMLFTVGSGVVTPFLPEELKSLGVIITIIGLITMCYGLYRRFTDRGIEEQEELKKWLQRNYVCPECGHFMGFQDYEVIIQNNACPYCKTQFKK